MSHAQDTHKDNRKKPQKTLMEKRAEKRAKKMGTFGTMGTTTTPMP